MKGLFYITKLQCISSNRYGITYAFLNYNSIGKRINTFRSHQQQAGCRQI